MCRMVTVFAVLETWNTEIVIVTILACDKFVFIKDCRQRLMICEVMERKTYPLHSNCRFWLVS